MFAAEVIARLQELVAESGDQEVFLDIGPDGLLPIEEIGIDMDDTGIIVWSPEGE